MSVRAAWYTTRKKLTSVQDECRTLLLLSQARTAEVGAARKLDHRLGERHRTGGACVLYRFHMVRSPPLRVRKRSRRILKTVALVVRR